MEIKICNEPLIKINGRTVKEKDPVHLFWSGSGIEFNIKAQELYVNVEGIFSTLEHYIAFEINGMVCQRLVLDGTKQRLLVFRNFNKDSVTHVRIIKEVQAMNEDDKHMLNIYSIETDGEIVPLKEKDLKIEFIGDSINSGEGAIGTGEEELWISHFFSHVRSYPYIVSKLLNADYRVFSKSGWGLHCAWDNNIECALPKKYEEVCSVMPNGVYESIGVYEKNDFSAWQPDAIVCNLCTNDDGAFHNAEYVDKDGNVYKLRMHGNEYDAEDVETLVCDAYEFLKVLRKNNSKSRIYWAFGILGDGLSFIINEAIARFNKDFNDSVTYIALPITEGDGFGARFHPGIISHKNSAYVIAEKLKDDFDLEKLERLIL